MRKDELTEIIDRSMGEEPGYRLPADFAQKVTASVNRQEQWKTDLQEYFLLTALFSGLILVASGIYYVLDKEFMIRVATFFQSNIIPLSFVIILLNFILFADKVLLRLLFSRRKSV